MDKCNRTSYSLFVLELSVSADFGLIKNNCLLFLIESNRARVCVFVVFRALSINSKWFYMLMMPMMTLCIVSARTLTASKTTNYELQFKHEIDRDKKESNI